MENNMSLIQEIRLTVNKINPNAVSALQKLEILLQQCGQDAYICEIKCLVEDIVNKPNDPRALVEMKVKFVKIILNRLMNQRPGTAIIVKTAFDTIDIPPGVNTFLQKFLNMASLPNDMTIWVCICTSSCTKQPIRQDAITLLNKAVSLIRAMKLTLPDDMIAEIQSVFNTLNSRSQTPNQSQADTPKSVASNSLAASSTSMELDIDLSIPDRIGRLLSEIGPRASSSETILKSIVTIPGDAVKSIEIHGLLHMLLVVANKEDISTGMTPTQVAETKEDIQIMTSRHPELRDNSDPVQIWDMTKLASVLKEVYGGLDVDHLMMGLDDPSVSLAGSRSFDFLVRLNMALTGKSLPPELLYRVWRNADKQVLFLGRAMEADNSVFDFAQSPTQIVSPSYFTGDVKSCWTSLDLLQVLLQLLPVSNNAMQLINIHIMNAVDVTVLIVALLQLPPPWTSVRKDLMATVLILKMMTLRLKPEQKKSITPLMQSFFTSYPDEAIDTVLRAYVISLSSRKYYSFFALLYSACAGIPRFLDTLIQIPLVPVQPNLRLVVHVVVLEAVSRSNAKSMELMLNQLLVSAKQSLVSLLLALEEEFLSDVLIVIDSTEVALAIAQYLNSIIMSVNVSPQSKQKFLEILRALKMDPNAGTPAGVNEFRTRGKQLLMKYLSLQTMEEKDSFLNQMSSMLVKDEGRLLFQAFVEVATMSMGSISTLQKPEVVNLAELIRVLIQKVSLPAEVIEDIILFICDSFSSTPRSTPLNISFSGVLLQGLLSIMNKLPMEYVSAILSCPLLQKMPDMYDEVKHIYDDMQPPAGVSAAVDAREPNVVVSPHLHDAQVSTTLSSPMTHEKLQQARSLQHDIHQDIVPIVSEPVEDVLEERLKNRISVLINNITDANLASKIDDLLSLLPPGSEKWFADFLVRSRIERQTNYHKLYMDLVSCIVKVRGTLMMDLVLDKSIQVTRELLTSDYNTFKEQHAFLKNLGEWLGAFTIGRDVCLSQLHLNLTQELLIAFYHKRLLYVYEFVCYLLRSCKESRVIRPPQPWLMAILSVLKEIREVPGIHSRFGYLFDNYLQHVGFMDAEIPIIDSDLYLAIPEVTNNSDFTDKATQEEVIAFFQKRYPQLLVLQGDGESSLRAVLDPKKGIREFVPKTMHGASPTYSPAGVTPSGASPQMREDNRLSVVLTEELRELLLPEEQAELRSNMEMMMQEVIMKYQNGFGAAHKMVVISAVKAMYARDLSQVCDTREVYDYMEKAAHTLVGDLLFSAVPLMEREFILYMYEKYGLGVAVLDDNRIQNLVKSNTGPMLESIRQWMLNQILNNLHDFLAEDRQSGSSVLAENHTESAMYNRFIKMSNVTENEKVIDGVLNGIQKNVYAKMVDAPALSEALLSEDALNDISVSFHYQHIRTIIMRLIEEESTHINFWDTRFLTDIQFIKEALRHLSTLFAAIEGHHVEQEDEYLVQLLTNMLMNSDMYSNYHIMTVFMELASFFHSHSVQNIPETLTASTLENVQLFDQKSTCVPVLTLLAVHDLLDVGKLDTFLQRIILQFVQENVRVLLPSETLRFLLYCVMDLLLVRELVGIDEVPLTMQALADVANTDLGKRSVRIDGSLFGFSLLLQSLQSKQGVISHRVAIANVSTSPEYAVIVRAVEAALVNKDDMEDVTLLEGKMDNLLELLDCGVDSIDDDAVFIILHCVTSLCYKYTVECSSTDIAVPRGYFGSDLLVSVIAALVDRETSIDDRSMVLAAAIEGILAVFFQSYDLSKPIFLPIFFLRVFSGLLKEVVQAQSTPESRDRLLLQYTDVLSMVSPNTAPVFIVGWIQLLSSPQLLSLLLSEGSSELMSIAGDLIVMLLTFIRPLFAKDITEVMRPLLLKVVQLLRLLVISFPGFLARRCTEICSYLPETELRAIVMKDCPPQCDVTRVPQAERDLFVEKAWDVVVEPDMLYKQDLIKVGLQDAVENVMRMMSVDQSLLMISRMLDTMVKNHIPVIRAIVLFWVLEEGRIRESAADDKHVLGAEECIRYLFKMLNQDKEYKKAVIIIMEDYIRFPCRETKLFMNTYITLYRYMDVEFRKMMADDMFARNDANPDQLGIVLTIKNLQRI